MSLKSFVKKAGMSFQALTLSAGIGISGLAIMSLPAIVPTASAVAAPATCSPTLTYTISNGAACAAPTGAKTTLFGTGGIFTLIANVLVFLVGAIAVIFLIVGGLRYVISNGDPKAVTAAKDTILYAIVGIVVALLAYALVNFVLTTFA